MKNMFGIYLDGYRLLKLNSTVGTVTLRPDGLLNLLETRLELPGVCSPQSVSVGQYQRCLKQADDGNRFYSVSFRSIH